MKNVYSAAVPNNPRSSSIAWFDPTTLALARLSPTKQIVVATMHRKNTISIAGMCSTAFTNEFARKKKSVDKNIARTPGVIKLLFSLKLSSVNAFPSPRKRQEPRLRRNS